MVTVVVLGFILSCLVILTPFEVQGGFFDSLAADGELESYTFKLYQFSWNVAIVIGIFCLLVFIYLIIFRNSARSLIGKFLIVATDIYKRVKLDTSSFVKMLIPGRADFFPLGGLLFITVFPFDITGSTSFIESNKFIANGFFTSNLLTIDKNNGFK